jgi:hypothetical protein
MSSKSPRLRTIVYVDGFNLYYGCLKGSPNRWLDLGALCGRVLRDDADIVAIKYFTARVKPRPGNPHQAQRQQIYLRALETVPNLTIHYGHFITRTAIRRLVQDRKGRPAYAEVWTTEEKGSDVNLASHLLIDGFRARYDLAVVISNDGDSEGTGPLRPPRSSGLRRSAEPPRESKLGAVAEAAAAWLVLQALRQAALAASQFPLELCDAQGTFRKPRDW